MKINIQKLPKSEIELKIEIPVLEFQGFIERAVLDSGQSLEFPGFRKGKAPKEIIEREVGRDKILKMASEAAIKTNYLKAIKENKIEAIGQPEITLLKLAQGNPLEFKAKVAILPDIYLSDYRQIGSKVKKQKNIIITDDELARIKKEKEKIESQRVCQEILDKIGENLEVELPEVLIEAEKKRMLEDLKFQVFQILQFKNFEDYLAKINKTEKEIIDSFLPEVEKRIKNSLILKEIGKKEKIEVSESEIDDEVNKILENPSQKNTPQTDIDIERLKNYTKEAIKSEKVFKFLESLAQ